MKPFLPFFGLWRRSWRRPSRDANADQTRRRDLPGEHFLRSLLRYLPGRGQLHGGRAEVSRRAGHAVGQRVDGPLLTHNPNAAQPFRLSRAQAVTCDQDHGYSAEQKAFNTA